MYVEALRRYGKGRRYESMYDLGKGLRREKTDRGQEGVTLILRSRRNTGLST